MNRIFKLAAAITAPLLLTGCFLLPGKFDAHLNLLDGDRYEFSYIGQVQMTTPDDGKPAKPADEPFDPAQLKCRDVVDKESGQITDTSIIYGDEYDPYPKKSRTDDDIDYDVVERSCSKKEIAAEQQEYEAAKARKQENYERERGMASVVFGGPVPGDDASMRAFAETLKKYQGWKKVEYVGGNIFDVEYKETGTIGSYFSFPVLPDAQMQYPFFQLVRRADGAVELFAPGIGGKSSFFNMMMLEDKGAKAPDLAEIDGTFTLETNGTVVTNNSADGFTEKGDRKVMNWKIGKSAPAQHDAPRAMIRF